MNSALVLDPRVLRRLEADIADAAALRMFLERYTELLPVRIQRIQRALRTSDRCAVTHAVRSLQAPSMMIGATALADRAEVVMQRAHNASAAMSPLCEGELGGLIRELEILAQQTSALLDELMGVRAGPCGRF